MVCTFEEIACFNFPLHTDAVTFSPCGKYVLCGSYELKEDSKSRCGHIAKFFIGNSIVDKVEEIHDLPGILDLCWTTSTTCLAASSSGELCTFSITDAEPIRLASTLQLSPASLLLSVDFDSDHKAITSDGNGNVFLVDVAKGSLVDDWKAHEFEPWCVRFNPNDRNLILSGGDDCLSRVWDQRVGISKPVLTKRHEMGVCSVSGVPGYQHLISTGCFDESLRVWDLRLGASSQEILICRTKGGGVWRHIWSRFHDENNTSNNNNYYRVLTASMHAGFAVATFSADLLPSPRDQAAQLAYYRPSAKLAYGVDWRPLGKKEYSGGFGALVAACSFYDNTVTFAKYTET